MPGNKEETTNNVQLPSPDLWIHDGTLDLKQLLAISTQQPASIDYRQISNIRDNESQYLNVSHFLLHLSLPNPMKPGVKSRERD